MKPAVALLLVAIVAGCDQPRPQQPPAQRRGSHLRRVDTKAPEDDVERTSILSLARGATVTFRTGEILLDNSALRAIDGDPMSFWIGPPNDLPQSMIIALPARTRIERVAIRTDEAAPANHILLERSLDGSTFEPLVTVTPKANLDAQWFEVTPAEATHVRVTMVDRVAPGRQTAIRSLIVRGKEIEALRPADLAGCWTVNDFNARFDQRGAAVTGAASMGDQPMELEGGFDGRTYRFHWIRGNDYGYALIAVAPDGRKMSGIGWHEEAIPLFYGESWFGERRACGPVPAAASDIRERYLRRASRFSLFGIRFRDDGTVDRTASIDTLRWLAAFASANPVQLIGHEFRRANDIENRAFAKRELDSLIAELEQLGVRPGTVTFVVKGSDDPRQKPESDAARALYSTVDVEIRR